MPKIYTRIQKSGNHVGNIYLLQTSYHNIILKRDFGFITLLFIKLNKFMHHINNNNNHRHKILQQKLTNAT